MEHWSRIKQTPKIYHLPPIRKTRCVKVITLESKLWVQVMKTPVDITCLLVKKSSFMYMHYRSGKLKGGAHGKSRWQSTRLP